MKIWIRSDLHTGSLGEINMLFSDPPVHDVAVLAGDTNYGVRRVIEAVDAAAERPVVVIAGNHEFYHRTWQSEIDQGRDASSRSQHVRFLENASWTVGRVRFLGCTLWSDFGLYGPESREPAMRYAAKASADFDLITMRERSPLDLNVRSHMFQPRDAVALFLESVAWLEEAFSAPHNGPTVVVTHHAPTRRSVSPEFEGDALTPCYVSNLLRQIERWQPHLWIHGHTHARFDYRVGRTRVVCNPRGIFHGVDAEESGYDPRLVVEI